MPYPESTDLPIEIFGGYCTSIPPSDLPSGASPLCQECMFPEAAVRQRDGILALSPINPAPAAGASVNGVVNYGAPTLQNYMLDWDSLGDLYQIDQSGNLILINQTLATANGNNGSLDLFMNSTTLFGRQYMTFTNNLGLADFPRQWDGTNYDRVSQCGPGEAPRVADIASGTTPSGAISQETRTGTPAVMIQTGNVVTLNSGGTPLVSAPGQFAEQVGDLITVSGATPSGYDGTFQLTYVDAGIMQWIIPTSGLGTSSGASIEFGITTINVAQPPPLLWIVGGTIEITAVGSGQPAGYIGIWPIRDISVTGANTETLTVYLPLQGLANTIFALYLPSGTISAGLHGMSVVFITRQGYITRPAPPVYWTAAGSLAASVTNIPIGPSNVVARLLLFTLAIQTPATTGTFYSIEAPVTVSGQTYSTSMLIQDNTTTSLTVSFRDSDLASGFNAEYLFTLIELGSCSAVTNYNNRLVFLGELNRLRNVLNFSFNGGWNLGGGTGGSDVPLGWTSDTNTTFGPGGSRAQNGGLWLDGYKITGDGALEVRGMIEQSVYQDFLNVNILSPLTSYSVRVWIASRQLTLPDYVPQLVVDIFSPTVGLLGTSFFALNSFASTTFQLSAPLIPMQQVIPADAIVRLYVSGNTLKNGDFVVVDSIELYPTKQPINTGIAWISYAFDPESFDGTLSQVQVRPNDGQQLRAGFIIRGNLYLMKDRYWAYATDDGVNEPANWSGGVVEVSNTIGCSGPNAVDTGEEWAVVANRNGAYIFWGSDPMKLTQGIQEDVSYSGKDCWNSTNWNAATTIWVRIDSLNKRILIAAPLNGATTPNIVWEMDYKFAPAGAEITSDTVYSAFMNKLITHGGGMKWNPWNITANSCGLIEWADGTQKTVFGSGLNDSNLNVLTAGQYSDNGAAINWIYTTYGQPSAEEEESLQLKAHVKLTDYVTGRAIGNGTMSLVLVTATRATPVRGIALSANPVADFERNVNPQAERVFFQVGTNAVGEWAQLEKLIGMQKQSPTVPVRGFGP